MAWQPKGNIRGPQGATGTTGAQGPQGNPGTPGEKWFTGGGVPSGTLGVNGDQYLNVANGDVYEKNSSGIWTITGNIKGPTGATGTQGIQGIQGNQGPQGNTGATGPAGTDGTPGEKWYSGAGAPLGATGIVGDWWLNTGNGDYYEKTGTSVWTLRGNLTGPQGATGAQGTAGVGVPTSGLVIGDHLRATSTTAWDNLPPSFFAANLTNPTGSTTTAASMAGFGGVAKITPNASGKLLVIWCGRFNQAGTSGTGKVEARYGTGTAPANGAAGTGTLLGNACYITFGQGINQFSLSDVISVTKGTAYWFDLTQASGLAGQALSLFDCSVSIVEL